MRMAVWVFIGVLVSGCDPYPAAELVNRTNEPITLRLAESGSWDTVPDRLVRIKPGKRRHFFQHQIRNYRLPVLTAECEYVFPVPAGALNESMGAMDVIELRDDLRIYQYSTGPEGGALPPPQPAGFPLAFISKACGHEAAG